jgi:hypothetical protein
MYIMYIMYIMYKIEINIYASKVVYENEQRTACWGSEGSEGSEGGEGSEGSEGSGRSDCIQASLKVGRRKNANHQ